MKSRVKTFRDVSSNIPKDFAFSKSHMGTPLDSIFFTHIFFSVTVLGPGRYPNQNLILYGDRSSMMILWKRGNFGESKLLWAYNGLKFIVDDDHEEDEDGGKNLC